MEGADCKKPSVAAHDVQRSHSALNPDGKLVLLIEGLPAQFTFTFTKPPKIDTNTWQNNPKLTLMLEMLSLQVRELPDGQVRLQCAANQALPKP